MNQEQMGTTAAPGLRVSRKMRQTCEDCYVSDGGFRMQREHGLTPQGNPVAGRWVLRGPEGEWIDHDQYRHDLLPRHGFVAE
jgi:hypothetical protein